MIDTTEKPTSAPSVVQISARSLTLAVALMSFAALLLELSLTRLFSVVLFYHFAFLAISIALLGLGAGAVFAYLRRRWLSRWSVGQLGSRLCLANAIFIFVVLEIVVHTAVSLHLDWTNFWRLTALYLAAAVPFFVTGLLFSVIFARHPARITQLYGADLVGGSLACLALVPLLNFIGGPNTIVFAAVRRRTGCSGVVGSRETSGPRVSHRGFGGADRRQLPLQSGRRGLRQGHEAHHPAVSAMECDLARRGRPAGHGQGDCDRCRCANVADEYRSASLERRLPAQSHAAGPALANVLRPHGDYAIIGPGGGVDVLRAVANGSPNVTGIEINPIIANDIMRDRYADYSLSPLPD